MHLVLAGPCWMHILWCLLSFTKYLLLLLTSHRCLPCSSFLHPDTSCELQNCLCNGGFYLKARYAFKRFAGWNSKFWDKLQLQTKKGWGFPCGSLGCTKWWEYVWMEDGGGRWTMYAYLEGIISKHWIKDVYDLGTWKFTMSPCKMHESVEISVSGLNKTYFKEIMYI